MEKDSFDEARMKKIDADLDFIKKFDDTFEEKKDEIMDAIANYLYKSLIKNHWIFKGLTYNSLIYMRSNGSLVIAEDNAITFGNGYKVDASRKQFLLILEEWNNFKSAFEKALQESIEEEEITISANLQYANKINNLMASFKA